MHDSAKPEPYYPHYVYVHTHMYMLGVSNMFETPNSIKLAHNVTNNRDLHHKLCEHIGTHRTAERHILVVATASLLMLPCHCNAG